MAFEYQSRKTIEVIKMLTDEEEKSIEQKIGEDEKNNKIWAIVQPAQSGKTGRMIQCILKMNSQTPNHISIIICDNSLLQTVQTNSRIYQQNLSSVIISSKSKEKITTICNDICEHKREIHGIIVCNNKKERQNIEETIRTLKKYV